MDIDLSGFRVEENKICIGAILSELTKRELQSLARTHHMKNYSRLKKSVLISYITEYILRRDVMRNYFLCMNDREIEYLRMARDYGGIIEDAEPEAFAFLIEGGYAGFTNDLTFAIPDDVLQVFDSFDTQEFDMARQRTVLIGDYSHVANYLYGVTPPMRVVKIFNRYEDQKTDWQEVVNVYATLSKYRCDFAYLDYFFVDRAFVGSYEDILNIQGSFPYYIPTYEQVRWWSEFGFSSNAEDIMMLYRYLTQMLWVDGDLAAEVCYVLECTMRVGCTLPDLQNELDKLGIRCHSQRQRMQLDKVLADIFNHARMVIYRGFTPEEIQRIHKG